MIKTINASVMPEDVTGYHQRFEYDTDEGICHEYRLGCSDSSVGVHETEPMTDEGWQRRCEGFIAKFEKMKKYRTEYTFHLEIDGETVV